MWQKTEVPFQTRQIYDAVRLKCSCLDSKYFDSKIIDVTWKFIHLQITAYLVCSKLSAIDFFFSFKNNSPEILFNLTLTLHDHICL